MARRYTYETTLSFGTDGEADYCEIDVTVSYAVSFGAPEQGPSYACGGVPADPDEITDIELIAVGGKPAPWGFHYWSDKHFAELVVERLEGCIDTLTAMLEAAHETEADALDRRDEMRAVA